MSEFHTITGCTLGGPVLISIQTPLFAAIACRSPEEFGHWMEGLEAGRQRWADPAAPILELRLPCGHTQIYQTAADVPRASVPCTCGAPSHWFIKLGESDA